MRGRVTSFDSNHGMDQFFGHEVDLKSGKPDYVILDVRSPEAYAAGHVPGAINLPHGRIVERNLATFPAGVALGAAPRICRIPT